MFIETETTPNPSTLKFLPGRAVMAQGTANFADAEAAARSPLALRLFALDGVTQVFFGADFVSVSKADAADGDALVRRVRTVHPGERDAARTADRNEDRRQPGHHDRLVRRGRGAVVRLVAATVRAGAEAALS